MFKKNKVIKYCDTCNKELSENNYYLGGYLNDTFFCETCIHIGVFADIGFANRLKGFYEPTKKQKEQASSLWFLLLEGIIELEEYKVKAEKLVCEYKKINKKREENKIKKAKKIVGGI